MKLIIAGSRNLQNIDAIFILQSLNKFNIDIKSIKQIVSGCSGNVDQAGIKFAKRFGYSLSEYPAKWDLFGKMAGVERNRRMADYANKLLVIWDGESKGSCNMITEMQIRNKPIYEVLVRSPIYRTHNLKESV